MKVVITHMKAPWPEGCGVGSVVEFESGVVLPWALGKCRPAEETEAEAKAVAVIKAPAAQADGGVAAAPAAQASAVSDIEKQAEAERASLKQRR